MVERLSSQAALERIQKLRDDNLPILGVDGFRARSDGFEAPVDLILDLSAGGLSVVEAASEAEKFVIANASADVTFEIVV